MNFDELQSAWHSDKGNDVTVPDSVTKLRSVATPVERIRKNMRRELFVGITAYVLMAASAPVKDGQPGIIPFVAMYIATTMMIVTYFIRFFAFYKRLNVNTLSSKDSLYEMYYDIKLNIELYKAYYHSSMPLLLLYCVMLGMDAAAGRHIDTLTFNRKMMGILAGTLVLYVVVVAIMYVLAKFWTRFMYEKHLKKVEQILNELREE